MRVAFDIGGTFTDVILQHDDGAVSPVKVLTIIDTLGRQVSELVARQGGAPVAQFNHGTTLVSNMVIESTTAPTALITTPGFRDVLDMRAQRRPNIYDPTWTRLPPLVPRRWCREVGGRVLSNGEVEEELDLDQARTVVQDLVADGVEAIAVCLINSYVNPVHERQLGQLIGELAPALAVCLSCDLNPEINEYERASTTTINASLVPGVRSYLDALTSSVRDLSEHFYIMRSNGGVMTGALARQYPVYMIESGPAAGALAAGFLCREGGLTKALSFDMGGTTAKACMIEDGAPLEKPGGEIGSGINTAARLFGGGGYAVRVPSLDIVEVGAGGGSIAWIDDSGALRVGPHSSSADPGPACYGHGGTLPTVTDANVVLGYMDRRSIAGATLTIDRDAAERAVSEVIAEPLGLTTAEAAYGICQVANATMMRALRAVSTERGRDPCDFSLIAFGGAGPMHAASLAAMLDIRQVHVPVFSGLFSAVGLLFADFRSDYARSMSLPLAAVTTDMLAQALDSMVARASEDMVAQGMSMEDVVLERHAELRYLGQAAEVDVGFPDEVEVGQLLDPLGGWFNKAHLEAFGYTVDAPVELVSLRLRAVARRPGAGFAELAEQASAAAARAERSTRSASFGPAVGLAMVSVMDRWSVEGVEEGPVIIEDPDTTVVVPPGWNVRRDEQGTLLLHHASGA